MQFLTHPRGENLTDGAPPYWPVAGYLSSKNDTRPLTATDHFPCRRKPVPEDRCRVQRFSRTTT